MFACTDRNTSQQSKSDDPHPPHSPPLSLSGVQLESTSVAQVQNAEGTPGIPGIGVISTSWVGYEGQQNILHDFAMEIDAVKSADLQKELRTLASVCLKAFQAVGTSLPEVQNAVVLCEQYVPKTKPSRDASSAPVVELWKSASSTSQNRAPEDRVDLAKSVLGEKIVSTITEEHKDPPHVRSIEDRILSTLQM